MVVIQSANYSPSYNLHYFCILEQIASSLGTLLVAFEDGVAYVMHWFI